MNHVYRVVFNKSTNTHQAVAEITRGHTKTHSSKARKSSILPKFILKPLILFISLTTSTFVIAAPTGGVVSAGDASIAHQGSMTNINQTSQNAAINWQSFDIKPNETVNFKQPSSNAITLNRVLGNDLSVLNGTLNANGQVFIQNPNGVLFSENAQINVGGLVATTSSISDTAFMEGNYKFYGQNDGLSVKNLGSITVPEGGVVALIAPIVKNEGQIEAPQGNVLLASAKNFSITMPTDGFSYTLDKGTLEGLVDNGGAIMADGGHIVLTSLGVDAVKKSVLNHTGIIEANTVKNNNGVIELLGDTRYTDTKVTGTLTANSKGANSGGYIETSGATLDIEDRSNVHIDKGTLKLKTPGLTIANAKEHITGEEVEGFLETNNVELASSEDDALNINNALSWDSNKLTLSSENDIHINQDLNGSESAKLAIEFGTKHKVNADVHLGNNKINLAEGHNLEVKQHGDEEFSKYLVIHSMPTSDEFPEKHIAIGKDIDISDTKNRSGFSGWNFPAIAISPNATKKHGYLWGLGHTLDGLTINSNEDNVGLIRELNKGVIRDITLDNVNVSGNDNTGALVGEFNHYYDKFLDNKRSEYSYFLHNNVEGKVKGSNSTGGLIGFFKSRGKSNAYGTVSSPLTLVNDNTISSEVSGINAVGGLIGKAQASSAGGIGINTAKVEGLVSGDDEVGGVIGYAHASETSVAIKESYVSSEVEGNDKVGGFLGDAGGGGHGAPSIRNSYFEGSVKGNENIGGFVGRNSRNGYISDSYVAGTVRGNKNTGAFAGAYSFYDSSHYGDQTLDISNSFYNTDSIKQLKMTGDGEGGNFINSGGKTTLEMKQRVTFENITNPNYPNAPYSWDFEKVWRIDEGNDYPRLRALTEATIVVDPTNMGIKANDLTKVYDGKVIESQSDLEKLEGWDGNGVTVDGLLDGDTLTDDNVFSGELRFDGEGSNWQGATNAGKYTIVPTGLGSQKYEIKFDEGNLTIDKRAIPLGGRRVYDGTTKARASEFDLNSLDYSHTDLGVVDSDVKEVTVTGSGTLESKDVREGGVKILEHDFKLTGSKSGNYYIKDDGYGIWGISKRPLTIYTLNHINREGTDFDRGDVGLVSNGLIEGERIKAVTVTQKSSTNDPEKVILTPSDVSLSKGKLSNYEVKFEGSELITIPENTRLRADFVFDGEVFGNPEDVQTISDYNQIMQNIGDELVLAGELVYKEDFGVHNTKGFEFITDYTDWTSGLEMAAYRNKSDRNLYYIVYRGSEKPNSFTLDWVDNAISIIEPSPQHRTSLNITEKWIDVIKRDEPNAKIILTGHSLGGNLAQYSGGILNDGEIKVATFNSSPLSKGISKKVINSSGNKDYSNFYNIIFDNEILQHIANDYSPYLNGTQKIDLFTNGTINDHKYDHMALSNQIITDMDENYKIFNDKDNTVLKYPYWWKSADTDPNPVDPPKPTTPNEDPAIAKLAENAYFKSLTSADNLTDGGVVKFITASGSNSNVNPNVVRHFNSSTSLDTSILPSASTPRGEMANWLGTGANFVTYANTANKAAKVFNADDDVRAGAVSDLFADVSRYAPIPALQIYDISSGIATIIAGGNMGDAYKLYLTSTYDSTENFMSTNELIVKNLANGLITEEEAKVQFRENKRYWLKFLDENVNANVLDFNMESFIASIITRIDGNQLDKDNLVKAVKDNTHFIRALDYSVIREWSNKIKAAQQKGM